MSKLSDSSLGVNMDVLNTRSTGCVGSRNKGKVDVRNKENGMERCMRLGVPKHPAVQYTSVFNNNINYREK